MNLGKWLRPVGPAKSLTTAFIKLANLDLKRQVRELEDKVQRLHREIEEALGDDAGRFVGNTPPETVASIMEDYREAERDVEEYEGLVEKTDTTACDALKKIGVEPFEGGFPWRVDQLCDEANRLSNEAKSAKEYIGQLREAIDRVYGLALRDLKNDYYFVSADLTVAIDQAKVLANPQDARGEACLTTTRRPSTSSATSPSTGT